MHSWIQHWKELQEEENHSETPQTSIVDPHQRRQTEVFFSE
jgi:hypothetical protein